nr:recombinase family protein [Methylobacterium radiotolerans JCM 2831]
MLVGYARVSTLDQNLDLQRDALHEGRLRKNLRGRRRAARPAPSGPSSRPPSPTCSPTDQLVVWKLDRLGRSLVEMMRTIDGLRLKEIHFRSADRAVRQRDRPRPLRPADARRHGRVFSRP